MDTSCSSSRDQTLNSTTATAISIDNISDEGLCLSVAQNGRKEVKWGHDDARAKQGPHYRQIGPLINVDLWHFSERSKFLAVAHRCHRMGLARFNSPLAV